MSKKPFKSQASASRAAITSQGGFVSGFSGFGTSSGLGASSSSLSFVFEPPDLSGISTPDVVVTFKNLLKNDATTKAKALEDLQAYISSLEGNSSGLEDAVIEAWIKLYPRTSIDSSRRVRQLAHVLQGQITTLSGRRMVKQMQKIVGAWLAGTWDNDRPVSQAAQNSINDAFPTEEKRKTLVTRFAGPILEYARDVLFRETVQSLSDERRVSPDDAEAKYARVVASNVCVIAYMLSELDDGDISKVQEQFGEIFNSPKLWDFAAHKDPFLRRSIYRLLRISISKQHRLISSSLKTISACVVSKGLSVDQSGSAWDFTETLLALTLAFTTVWTEVYPPKRPVVPRLQQFLKKGSQGGPPEFWGNVGKILLAIPIEVLLQDRSTPIKLLEAYQSGMNSSQEPRSNARSAWIHYFSTSAHFVAILPEDINRYTVIEQCVIPVFEQYLRQTDEKTRWSLATQAPEVCANGFDMLVRLQLESIQNLLELEWRRLAEQLIEDINTSLPEQSKNFAKSQDCLAQEGTRWFSLQKILTERPNQPNFVLKLCRETSISVVEAAIKILTSRNGRPYGAAAVVNIAIMKCPDLLFSDVAIGEISTFVKSGLPTLILSPSASVLISLLYSYGSSTNYGGDFKAAWTTTVKAIISSTDSAARSGLIRDLLKQMPEIVGGFTVNAQLESIIIDLVKLALHGEGREWDVINEALRLRGQIISENAMDQILSEMTSTLALGDKAEYALQGFESFIKKNKLLVKSLLRTKKGSEIFSHVLFLSESAEEELSLHAETVKSSLEALISESGTGQGSNESMVDIIKAGLFDTNPNSVSVQSLVSRAQKLLEQSNAKDHSQLVDQLVPDLSQWERAIQPFIAVPPKPSLAITDSMAGCIHLVERKSLVTDNLTILEQPRDSSGFSTAIRIASYTAKLVKSNEIITLLSRAKQVAVFQGLILIKQLANDNLGLAGANNLWTTYSPEVEAEMLDFTTDAHEAAVKLLEEVFTCIDINPKKQEDLFYGGLLEKDPAHSISSAQHFYKTRALSSTYADLLEIRGFAKKDGLSWMEALAIYRKNEDVSSVTAIINGASLPNYMGREFERLRDRLISDLSGFDISKDVQKGLRDLTLLNVILSNLDETATPIPQQRVVFFLKNLTSWFDFKTPLLISGTQAGIVAEVAKTLTATLPQIKGMSDSVWPWSLQFISQSFSTMIDSHPSTTAEGLRQEEELPVVHAVLKLYSTLSSIRTANSELEESWSKDSKGGHSIAKGLVGLLRTSPSVSDDFHQPQKVVNNLLSRLILEHSALAIANHGDMYALLNYGSRAIQRTAFEVLHRYIPKAQEDISLNAALEKITVKLPPELLSLILEVPSVEDLDDDDFERSMPLYLRGYLLSWSLVFDHFTNASLKVRRDYIEDLKEGNYLPGLLYFMLDFLGRSGKFPDASSFDIVNYQLDVEDSAERDTQWLLLNLYFRCLILVPSLTRTWWFNCGRGTVQKVEQYTEKYISPFVIENTLRRVNEWMDQQTTEEKKLQLKVSKWEVTAGYEVDEQTVRIIVRLPPAYPLQQATVDGVNRVGVDEKKWQAWLLSTKGVINFSDGSVVDGLQNWRSNVERAFKGQTECAICYSIVSSDKELPTKRCSTCKNLFHASCLFKWFKSSNASSCPLCRNPFNYDSRN